MAALTLEQWQSDLIEATRVARLATVTTAGTPHLVPVCFAFVSGVIAVPVDEKPKSTARLARLRNIGHEPRVALLIDRYDEDWTQLAWVRLDGIAAVAERGDAHPAALAALRDRYPQYRSMALEPLPLILFEPVRVTGWRWAGGW